MSFTVFLGNLPTWVTADDIKSWLASESLVADAIKVIRNPETQESKGFAFIEAPNAEEMQSIIRRFDRAPLEDRLLRANPAQPPKSRSQGPQARPSVGAPVAPAVTATATATTTATAATAASIERTRRGGRKHKRATHRTPQSAFAEELAKAL